MSTEKLKKIESLNNEVVDFQPVLHELFKRLPNVSSVECKQGPSEKGADFVLIKNDDTLGEETYIGVICKVGKITQNHTEVERQIEECKIYPRYVSSGKKKIHLNEIWVVTNSSISSNAEEKINLNNKNTNVRFINGSKVTELVDKYYSEFWSFDSVSYGQYFSELEIKLASGKDASYFGILESGNFIERKVVNTQVKKNRAPLESLSTVIMKERFIFLEGHVGSGKSTLIRQLVDKQKSIIKENEDDGFLPIIFHYSEVNTNPITIPEIITQTLKRYNISNERGVLVVIDGIDEVKDSLNTRIETLRSLVNIITEVEGANLLVTSRIMDSLQDYDAVDKMFSRYSIVPLSIKQIISFVDKICSNEQISQKLTRGIEKTPLFRFIPRTPISAILLARILTDEIKELPSTMTELYAKYTEVVLGRWDTSKGLMSQTEYEIIHNVLMDISEYMMNNGLTFISESEVETFYLEYTQKRNINFDLDKVYNRLLHRSEVAYINTKNNNFSFVHRSFMEYFYAEKLMKKNNVILDERIYNMYWTNTYFFFLGLMRDSEECIDAINGIKPTHDEHRFTRIFTNGSFYLAAYLTPYEKIKKGVMETFIEAGKLYDDAITKQSNTPLNQFSPIALLCIITKSLYNNYAYEYFIKALRESINDLNKTVNISDAGLYSLFFASATLSELGYDDAFNELVEKQDPDMLIQLGIDHVLSETQSVSTIVERYMKKLKKRYRGNKLLNNYVVAVHEKSIEELEMIKSATP